MRARRSRFSVNPRGRIDPRRQIRIHHLTEGPAKGWIHTHGLATYGHPELEIRSVPGFLARDAGRLLNDFADYLLNDAARPLLAGQLVEIGGSSVQVIEGKADEEGGYDPAHYAAARLLLVDPPATGCECDECAKELARRSPLPS